MKIVLLIGLKDQIEAAIERCVINHDFHPENAQSVIMKDYLKDFDFKGLELNEDQFTGFRPYDLKNQYTELLIKAIGLSQKMDLSLQYRDYSASGFTYADTKKYILDLEERLEALNMERRRLLLESNDSEHALSQLEHIRNVELSFSSLTSMEYVKFRFGRIPRNAYDLAYNAIAERSDMFFLETSVEKDYVYGICLILPSAKERADRFFNSLGFERIWVSEKLSGTVEEAYDRLSGTKTELVQKIENVTNKIKSIIENEKENLLYRYSYIRFMNETLELVRYAAHSSEMFYLVGWVPNDSIKSFKENVEKEEGFYCLSNDPDDMKSISPPIKRKTSFFSSIFTPFLEMYGLPAYKEIDPGFFFALTYTFMFGIMYGDVGQGMSLIVIGILMYMLKGSWLGKMLACFGVSSTAFGFVYGSVFGYEHILPGLKVLEGENMMRVLIGAVAIGIVILIFSMGINIANGIRQKNIDKIFFSPNGLAGAIAYTATVAGAFSSAFFGYTLFTTPYIICLIVLPLFAIFLREPLTHLVQGKKDWLPHDLPGYLIESFFELFESLMAYASNTISFLRVGAFAISHAGMMMVVFLLSATANGGQNIFGVIIGNICVMGIEAVLVCIQLLRLEFYEIFGRFYESGGKPFQPRYINYSEIK